MRLAKYQSLWIHAKRKHLELPHVWREAAGFLCCRTRRPPSPVTPVSMTTGNIHKVFPAISRLPKRLVRGEDFKIHYIMEEFPLCRAVTQKVRGREKKKRRKKI